MRVGIVRHGIGTPEVPSCSTKPLVLLAGAVRDRTRLGFFRADYIEHHFEARAMLHRFLMFCVIGSFVLSFFQNTVQRQMRELEKSVKTKRPGSVEQDSTMGPNFAICSICPSWNLVGECLPQTLHLFCFRRSDGIRRPPFSQMKEEQNGQNLQHTGDKGISNLH